MKRVYVSTPDWFPKDEIFRFSRNLKDDTTDDGIPVTQLAATLLVMALDGEIDVEAIQEKHKELYG